MLYRNRFVRSKLYSKDTIPIIKIAGYFFAPCEGRSCDVCIHLLCKKIDGPYLPKKILRHKSSSLNAIYLHGK